MIDTAWPPTRAAALQRLAAVDAAAYARSRNHLEGAVTGLSPYLTHGLLSVPECLEALRLPPQHKLVYEFGWREYFRHVWVHRGEGILHSLHPGPLSDAAYAAELPQDIRRGATGVPVVDEAVRTLYARGWLHNHARLWLASYVVHARKVHWRAGADWMLAHLLDGDLGSNHLSWQWVAGTASHKPYLFDAANVARFAPPPWHSEGSAIDLERGALEALAREPRSLAAGRGVGVEEPALTNLPQEASTAEPLPGADLWLAHPWALGEAPAGTTVVALVLKEAHGQQPWSRQRWAWVQSRMAALSPRRWVVDRAGLVAALRGAARVRTLANPHISPWLPEGVQALPEPRHFPDPECCCSSFSKWWSRVSR
ncbi:FAD-binding domain-containing protein [Inhella sp.]|uniref:FAD-binding domain-containing protein n=1 Tax=Inhella sp. TaxID=1921806 RepID=UPI0035B438BF